MIILTEQGQIAHEQCEGCPNRQRCGNLEGCPLLKRAHYPRAYRGTGEEIEASEEDES